MSGLVIMVMWFAYCLASGAACGALTGGKPGGLLAITALCLFNAIFSIGMWRIAYP